MRSVDEICAASWTRRRHGWGYYPMSGTSQIPAPRGRWRIKTEDSTFILDFDTNEAVFAGGSMRFVHALVKVGKPMQLLTFRDDVETQPSKVYVTSPIHHIESA